MRCSVWAGLLCSVSVVLGLLPVHPAAAAPANFFGDLYTGNRTNFSGQVGFRFKATSSFYIESLGRAVNPDYNSGLLQESHTLRLFDEDTQYLTGWVSVDGSSSIDGLGYAYADLLSPVPISQGRSYVLTTHESSGGPDRWRDSLSVSDYDDTLATVTARVYGYGSAFPSFIGPGQAAYGVPTFYTDPTATVSLLGRNFQNKAYTGTRDDISGQVGAHFHAFDDFEIKALARGATGGTLNNEHTLRLWDFDTQQVLGEVTIDSYSPTDGDNVLGLLPQPVTINKGQRFLITTTESSNSGDPWYGGSTAGSNRMIDHLNIASVVGTVSGNTSSFPTSMNIVGDGYAGVTFYGDLQDRDPGYSLLTDHYGGERNSHNGAVGYQFVAEQNMRIGALGRPVSYRFHDNELVDDHRLLLWHDNEDGSDGTLLGSVTVGPGSLRDDMNYAFAYLDEPIQLIAGETYRLVSEEFSRGTSGDPWMELSWVPNYDSSRIDILRAVWYGDVTSFPANFGSSNAAYVAPTMYFIPEPASGVLLLVGMGLGGVVFRRRRPRG